VSLIRLEAGAYYRFGSSAGLRPVDVFVGRIDEPADLGMKVDQPVVSMVVTSSRPGMPVVGLAPFYLSALFPEGVAAVPPFDLLGADFGVNYRQWRAAWEAGEAEIWNIGPAQMYRQAIEAMVASQNMIRRPN
jgi:hypothetical protein